MTTRAYCWASGEIEFTTGPIPAGALPIHTDENGARLVGVVAAVARHGYDNATLLVPGIPEADDQTAGLDALHRFRDLVVQRCAAWQAGASEVA